MASPLPRWVTVLAFLAFGTAAPVRAQTWTGGASTSWSNAANWSTTVPGSGGTALFNGPGNGNVAIDLGGSAQPIGTILFDTANVAAYTFSGNAGDAFTFDAGGAITINSTVSATETFNTPLQFLGAFTATNNGTGLLSLNGNTTLASGGAAGLLTIAGTGNTTFNGVIGAGSVSGLTKSGTGQLTLTAANTFNGTTTLSAGSLRLANGLALQSSTLSNAVAGGVIFDSSVASNTFTLGGLSGAGAIALQNNAGTPAPIALTIGANNAGTTYSGVMSGAGSLTKIGTGTSILSNGGNSFTGNVVVNSGTLQTGTGVSAASANTAFGAKATPGRTIMVNAGATLNLTTNNVFGGGGGSAASLYSIIVNGGTFSSTRYNMLPNVTLNGGTLVQSATDGVTGQGSSYEGYQFIGTITVGGSSPSTISTTNGKADHLLGGGTTVFNVGLTGTSDADLNVTSPFVNGSGDYAGVANLTKTGPGTMRLSVGNPNQAGNVTVYSGVTTVSAGKFMVVPTAMSTTATATVADGAAFGVFNTSNASVSIATLNLGASTGGSLAVELAGTPAFIPLSITSAFNTAGTNTVNISSSAALSVGEFPLVQYPGSIGGAGFAGLTLGSLPPRVLASLVNNSANSTVDLNVTGTDTIRWNGTVNGTWDINTTQNWKTNSTGANTVYLQPTAPGDIVTFNDQAAGNFIVNIPATVTPGGVTVDITTQNYMFTGAAGIAGAFNLVKNGTGTLTVANNNTYSGGTTINGGTIAVGAGGTTGSLGSGPITDNGALAFNRSDAVAIGTVISGTGSLTQNGSGNLTLSAFNTYTGGTTVNAGTLTLTAGGTGTGNIIGVLTINAGGTVLIGTHDVFGYNNAATTLSTLIINGGTLDKLAGSGVNETLTGVAVNMTGGLWAGTGGFYDMFTNGYGDTSVNVLPSATTATISASLNFRSANTVFTVASGTTPSGTDLLVSGILTGPTAPTAFGFVKEGPGKMVLTAVNTFTGPTTINNGTLQLGDGTVSGSLASTAITNNAALVLNPGPTNMTLPGVISGTGTVTKIGPNAATFSGANSYTGDTNINAGILRYQPGAAANMATVSTVNVAAGGKLAVASFDTASTVVTISSLNLTATGAALNFELVGSTTAAPLVVGTAFTTTGTDPVNVSSGTVLSVGQFPLVQYPGSIGGAGFAGLALGSLPPRVLATLVNNTTNNTVDLNVTASDTIRWNGTINGIWDINTTQNWKTNSTGADTVYLQPTAPGDIVTFNDQAAGNFTVTIPATVTPASITVDNTTHNYTFTGAGAIAGNITLVKNGTGTLTLANPTTFTGGATINAGTVVLTNDTTYTGATAINAGGTLVLANNTVSASNVTINAGGTLMVGNGGTTGLLPAAFTNNGSLVFNRSDAVTVTVVISGTGSVTQQGTGSVMLTNLNNSFSGDLIVASGTLIAANALNPTASPNSSMGSQSPTRTIRVNVGATLSFPSNNAFLGGGGSAANLPQLVVAGLLTSTRYNALPNLTLNGGTLDQSATDTGGYEGYQFLGTVTVGGTSPSTISTGNGKANHLLGGSSTEFIVADATGGSGPSLIVSAPLRDGSGDYPGIGGLTKSGPGIMLLSAANIYTGPTTINAGTLIVTGNNAAATGAIYAAPPATLRGTNILGGPVTVDGAIGAGNSSVGTLTLANGLAVNAGGRVIVQLAGPATPAAANTGGSTLGTLPNPTSNNFLDIAGGVASIDPGTLITINGAGVSFAQGQSYSYQILRAPATDLSALNITNQAQFTAVGFSANNFSLTGNSGGAVYVNFVTPVPEPAAVLVICLAGFGVGYVRRRVRSG
jgi:fibronectin-binding autotransporter adhesin